mgnify:FL=1
MILALVGNQNCGKTTIFNKITNLKQHVGNFPGVTVEHVVGTVPNYKNCKIVDLPGLYSLNTYTSEEKVTRDFLYKVKPDVIINVVDATNLQRNLYLTMQLKEIGIPMIIALNMLDEVEKNKGKINTQELSRILQLPIVKLSTVTKEETEQLIYEAIQNKRIYNINTPNLKQQNKINEKYSQIENICNNVVKMPRNMSKNNAYKIDKILTNKFLGLPIFFFIMYIIFNLTFNIIGNYFTELLNQGIEVVSNIIIYYFETHEYNLIIESLIIDGILNGIGSVISFLPIIVTLYFFLSILEDSGYMTRIAFIMDKPLSKIGLSGKSIVPILLGFGCSVPAILSIRTIQSEKERDLSLILVPFISCSAKIPIYAIFVSIFFKDNPAMAMTLIYAVGIIIGITVTALVGRKRKNDEGTFIMELPNYRIPSLKNTWHLMWNKTKEFLIKSFSVIFIASLIIWFLKSFNQELLFVPENESMLAMIGQKISFIFKPLGFSDWKIATSIIVGISAKEAILSTLSVLTNASSNMLSIIIGNMFTRSSAISFLAFILLYTPCIATIGIIKKEFGIKKAIKIVFNQFFIAYIISFLIYKIV